MERKNIIVIGASSGGLEALKELLRHLNPNISAAILIVLHISPSVLGMFPSILSKYTTMSVKNARDFEGIEWGRIYVAPPDHHLLVDKGHVRITKGPKENRFRPAVDPLFRSAAYNYGTRVIGIVLSGQLDDGTAGLWTIKHFGGTAIVQDPSECEFRSMPESALRQVKVDYKLKVAEMAPLLEKLVNEFAVDKELDRVDVEKTAREVDIAKLADIDHDVSKTMGSLTKYTCPECHGVLSAIREGNLIRFRCHTGHAFSEDTLLAIISGSVESSIWNAIRGMEEVIFLLNGIGDHFSSINDPKTAALYFKKAKEMEQSSKYLRRAIQSSERLTKDFVEGKQSV